MSLGLGFSMGTQGVAGYSNQYRMLLGSDTLNERFNLGDALDGITSGASKSFTWSVWVQKQLNGTAQAVIGKWVSATNQKSYLFRFEADNTFKIFMSSNGSGTSTYVTTDTYIDLNNDIHILIDFDADASLDNKFTLYINNSAVALTRAGTETQIFNGSAQLEFGAINEGVSSFLNAFIDEFSIWGVKFNASERTEIYNSGVPSDLTKHSQWANNKGWWRMGENANFNSTTANEWHVPDVGNNTTPSHANSDNMEEADINPF